MGWTWATEFISSGNILCLGSAVPLQATSRCSMVSLGAEHRGQEGSNQGWSMSLLSAVRRSPVRSFR